MRIEIPENLKGKELYKFLIENKSAIVAQKKALPKCADPVNHSPIYFNTKESNATKTIFGEIPADANSFRVRVVANTAMWVDSHMDVLLRDSAAKSMRERKGNIPHLHDHIYQLDAEVGDVVKIVYEDLQLSELGINKPGTAQGLVFETDIKKDYNEKVFYKYKQGRVKQHSIGLQYVKIELAINDPDYEKEADFWNKYYDMLLNPEAVDEKGYFWVVSEYKLLENSAVLFGSNPITPTLSVGKQDTEAQPPKSTENQPSKSEFDVSEYLKTIKIFN